MLRRPDYSVIILSLLWRVFDKESEVPVVLELGKRGRLMDEL